MPRPEQACGPTADVDAICAQPVAAGLAPDGPGRTIGGVRNKTGYQSTIATIRSNETRKRIAMVGDLMMLHGTEECRVCGHVVLVRVTHDPKQGELLIGYIPKQAPCSECGNEVMIKIPYPRKEKRSDVSR